MNDNIITLPNGDFKVERMEDKKALINGKIVSFKTIKHDSIMTESIEHNFLGYGSTYWVNGIKYESLTQIKFYK